MEPERACLILARTPGLSARRMVSLLPGGGDAAGALERLRQAAAISPAPGLPLSTRARAWLNDPDERLIEADRRWIEANQCQLLPCTSSAYPAALLQHPEAPPVLFVQGNPGLLQAPQLAMVGARAASPGGRATAREFAARLAGNGLAITSGLALGIDAASHEGALAVGGATLAVCAHGLDLCYPREHAALAARIRREGALVGAWPPGTKPQPYRFVRRDGFMAALSLATLVVEARLGSGALITARGARDLGRRVFAIPGAIRDPLARGCLDLIREGAGLVHCPEQVLADLKITLSDHVVNNTSGRPPEAPAAAPPLDKELEMLLDAAGFEPVGIDVLANRTGQTGAAVASMLLMLELQGRIASQPGGRYCRLS